MTKNVKNILCIVILLITCVFVYLTMTYIKDNVSENFGKSPTPSISDKKEMPNINGDNLQEPPEKPSGDDKNNKPSDPPNDNENNMNGYPEKPYGEMNMIHNSNKKIDTKYYITFAIEGLIISLIIIYLILTKFNSISIKELFINKDKIIIFSLSSIILAIILTYSFVLTTNKLFLNNDSNMNIPNYNTNVSYTAVKEITSDENISGGEYNSLNKDENSIMVSGSNSSFNNITVNKTGDSKQGDNTSFYGINSAIIAKGKAILTIKNSTINTDANGANGVFSYGGSATTNNSNSDNTTVNISDSKITTNKDNSGGIMTTGGGIMNATNLEIVTYGTSSAAIRSDRGGGTVNVDSGTYTTNGKGSPSIYSTANITVKNANLISNVSEGIIIEGKNSVLIENTTLYDNNTQLNGQSTTYKNIFIYQSMSGDAAVGNATFSAKNSTITTNKGDTLYVTNTTATINLSNNKIINNDKTGNFLRIQKDSWGDGGSNGGAVTLILDKQKVTGNITVDSLSTLNLTLKNNSYIEGNINKDNSAKNIVLTIDKSSKLKLTSDIYISKLNNEDETNSNIDFNGHKLFINNKEIK